MSTELRLLGASVLLGLLHILLAATLSTRQRGLKWNAGNRDGTVIPLTGEAGRAERAAKNFLETYPLFVAAVLAITFTGRTTAYTVLGAQLYFWSRLAYLPVYVLGITYVRSIIWTVSLVGLILVAWGMF